MNLILETPQLALREMTPDDLDFVAEMLGDEQVMRFYPRSYTREESRQWIQRQQRRYEEEGHGLWLVLEKQSGTPVGQVGLVMQEIDGLREPEVGYLIHHPWWRRGYASEAAAGVRSWAHYFLHYERVISLIRPVNIPSQRVAIKIGMKPEKLATYADLEHLVFAAGREKPEWES